MSLAQKRDKLDQEGKIIKEELLFIEDEITHLRGRILVLEKARGNAEDKAYALKNAWEAWEKEKAEEGEEGVEEEGDMKEKEEVEEEEKEEEEMEEEEEGEEIEEHTRQIFWMPLSLFKGSFQSLEAIARTFVNGATPSPSTRKLIDLVCVTLDANALGKQDSLLVLSWMGKCNYQIQVRIETRKEFGYTALVLSDGEDDLVIKRCRTMEEMCEARDQMVQEKGALDKKEALQRFQEQEKREAQEKEKRALQKKKEEEEERAQAQRDWESSRNEDLKTLRKQVPGARVLPNRAVIVSYRFGLEFPGIPFSFFMDIYERSQEIVLEEHPKDWKEEFEFRMTHDRRKKTLSIEFYPSGQVSFGPFGRNRIYISREDMKILMDKIRAQDRIDWSLSPEWMEARNQFYNSKEE